MSKENEKSKESVKKNDQLKKEPIEELKPQGKEDVEKDLHLEETEEVTVKSDDKHDKLYEETLDVDDDEPVKNKSVRILGITLISIAALIIIVVVYFFIFPAQWRSLTGQPTYTTESIENTEENVDVVDGMDIVDESENDTKNVDILDQVADIDKEEPKAETLADEEPVTEESATINSVKWGLELPCYVISHSAYSTEQTAKQIKAKMTQKGFKVGYFYIPDLQPGGKPLFKVFVGPFTSRQDAEKILVSVKKENSAAYVTKLEK